MASYHCTVKVGGAGKGAAHSAYIAREGKYEAMLERGAGEKLEHVEHGNMPDWAKDRPLNFWEAADVYERKNGSVYREFELALPRELSPEQRRELVQDFVRREIGDRHTYTFAIHCPRASLAGGEQPHAHIMWSERTRDSIERDPEQYFKRANKAAPEKGGCLKSNRFSGGKTGDERRLAIQGVRANWAAVQNSHLERAGHTARVDHRSLKTQGIERQPERHFGARQVKAMPAQEVADLLAARVAEGRREQAQREVSRFDLSGDLEKAKAERQQAPARAELEKLAESFKANYAATQVLEKAAQEFKANYAAEERALRERQAAQQKHDLLIQVEKEQKAQELEKQLKRERDGPKLSR